MGQRLAYTTIHSQIGIHLNDKKISSCPKNRNHATKEPGSVNEETYIQKELRRLEMQQKALRDNYNTLDEQSQEISYNITSTDPESRKPHPKETLAEYASRLSFIVHHQATVNTKTHVTNGKKVWYTHRNPMGCFMCKDNELLAILLQTITHLSIKYPKISFNPESVT